MVLVLSVNNFTATALPKTMTHTITKSDEMESLAAESLSALKIMLQTFWPPLLLLGILTLIYRATLGLSINIMFFNVGKITFKSISTTFRQALSMCCVRQRRRPHQCRRWINEIYSGSFVSPIDR